MTNILQGFRNIGLMKDTDVLVLQSIPSDISQKDIRVYLQANLSCMAQSFGLKSWPSGEALAQLVERPSGLFIFAVTVDQNASSLK